MHFCRNQFFSFAITFKGQVSNHRSLLLTLLLRWARLSDWKARTAARENNARLTWTSNFPFFCSILCVREPYVCDVFPSVVVVGVSLECLSMYQYAACCVQLDYHSIHMSSGSTGIVKMVFSLDGTNKMPWPSQLRSSANKYVGHPKCTCAVMNWFLVIFVLDFVPSSVQV